MKKATQQQTKVHNRSLVLRTIIEHSRISRAEIARVTNLTRTTVSDIVADLIAEGLVGEVGLGESQGGKNPILLSLMEDSRYLIGLDLAYNGFLGAVFNLRGKVRFTTSQPATGSAGRVSGDEAIEVIYAMIDRLMETSLQPIVGIGVATPGLVNTPEGMIVNAVNLDWQNLPLAAMLEERYHLPAYVLNDSQAAAMGEYNYGEGHQQDSNLVVINVRQGIGAGIIIDHHLFQGDGGGAGEIGHIVVVAQGGLRCRCGKTGCLETVTGTRGLIEQARGLAAQNEHIFPPGKPVDLDAILCAYEAGEPQVQQMVANAAWHMGLAISNLVGALNIQKIVITGDVTRFGAPWLEMVQSVVSEHALSRLAAATHVEFGHLGENEIILGASAMLTNNSPLLFTSH